MNDEAAHLVDHVLPRVQMRQWVLSFPYKLRYQMAHDSKLTNKILNIFIQAISLFQKKRARLFGIKFSKSGVVTFIQRFGSALNLNVHFHAMIPDGIFYKINDDDYEFSRLPEPTQEELYFLVGKIQKRVLQLIEKTSKEDSDQICFDDNALTDLAAMSITGQGLKRLGIKKIKIDPESDDPYSANVGGFSLNARVCVGGKDRKKLEKLIRYMARGPIATERLTEGGPNQLIYKMKTRWRDGTSHISFSPLDFIARLVALIPPAKMNLVRYHGVFAPNFKDRALIVPRKISSEPAAVEQSVLPINKKLKRERMRWSEMLKRTFEIDVTVCSKCGGRLEQIAVIKDRVVIKAILKSLKQNTIFNPLQEIFERGPSGLKTEYENEYDQGVW